MDVVLYHRLGQAINTPGEIVGERQKHRAGLETVKAWQHRAVIKVLEEQGLDPYAPLRSAQPTDEGAPWTHGTRLGREHRDVRVHLVEDHGVPQEQIDGWSDGAVHGHHDGVHRKTWAYADDLPHPAPGDGIAARRGKCQCSTFPMAGDAADCPNHVAGSVPIA